MGVPRNASATCPGCEGVLEAPFYVVRGVPVHSTLLFASRQEAMDFPRGDLALALCPSCGFITNTAFTAEHQEYSSRYEETQGFSKFFQEFHADLARRLIQRFDLHGKRILEIGCGKGEFLNLLCAAGDNSGIGFDPVYVPERNTADLGDRVVFVRGLYSEAYSGERADFVCCKMTLEHIPDTREFVCMIRRTLEGSPETVVFFQVPAMERILRERAFWDVYYEHCSYFTADSLRMLFELSGFDVLDVWTEYGGQVLMIACRPGKLDGSPGRSTENIQAEVLAFGAEVERTIAEWRERLLSRQRAGRSIVIWGAGSKGVAFLSKLGSGIDVRYAVDVNPYKHGTFLAGTGQEIVAPASLRVHCPGVVVVMNPMYVGEITDDLKALGVETEILALS
jgi:SAM-dependent methyltransferase